MVDRKELEALIAKIDARGGACSVSYDTEGWINEISVSGIKGVGPFPMRPIAFAETVRPLLAARG